MSPVRRDREVKAYQAEWYGPGIDGATARAAIARLTEHVDAVRRGGWFVETVAFTFVPREQAVLCVVRAESADLVAELGRRANVPFDRIVEAVLFVPVDAAVVDGKEW